MYEGGHKMKKRTVAEVTAAMAAAAVIFSGCGTVTTTTTTTSSSDGTESAASSVSTEVSREETEAAASDAESGSSETKADSSAKPYEGVTLSIWGISADSQDNLNKVLDAATEELGMTFETELTPGGTDEDNIMKTRCASGELADLSLYQCGSTLFALNPSEYFYDLSGCDFVQKYDESYKSVVSQDGKVFGAPFGTASAGAVVYWKPDYEELGLKVPDTWEDFVSNCQKLKDAGKTPIELTCGDTWTTQILFLGDNYNVVSADPDFPAEFTAGKAKFATTPAALRSWQKYGDLIDFYNDDATAATYNDAVEALGTGQVTHYFITMAIINTIEQTYPEAKGKLGVFGVPGDDPDNHGLTVWEPKSWYVAKNSKNIDACLAFLDFFYEKDTMDMMVTLTGADGPSCIKGYTLPETDSISDAVRIDEQAYFDAGKTAPALEFVSPVKGASCEQITTSAALGQITGEEAAERYDDDCKKSALQQNLDWE